MQFDTLDLIAEIFLGNCVQQRKRDIILRARFGRNACTSADSAVAGTKADSDLKSSDS